MAKIIRMDPAGHSTLAEWTAEDEASFEAAVEEFRHQLDEGWIAIEDHGDGNATQLLELPREAELVILRRPISGG